MSEGRRDSGRGRSSRREPSTRRGSDLKPTERGRSEPTAFEWPEFERPDPGFIRRLEDDTRRSYEDSADTRRSYEESRRRAAGGSGARDSGEAQYPEHRHGVRDGSDRPRSRSLREGSSRRERRSRLAALLVLVGVIVAITIVGLEVSQSEAGPGGGRSVPFSLLPLDGSRITATTTPATTTPATTTPATTTPATTSPATTSPPGTTSTTAPATTTTVGMVPSGLGPATAASRP